MSNLFFERPILNSPYAYPARYWELDATGQPTQRDLLGRRPAEYITPIPPPRKRKKAEQAELDLLAPGGLSDDTQKYDPISIINELRFAVRSGPYLSASYGQTDKPKSPYGKLATH